MTPDSSFRHLECFVLVGSYLKDKWLCCFGADRFCLSRCYKTTNKIFPRHEMFLATSERIAHFLAGPIYSRDKVGQQSTWWILCSSCKSKQRKKKSGESTKSSPGDNHSQTTMQISRRDLISLAAERPLAISTYEGTRTLFTLFSCVSHLFGGTCFYDCATSRTPQLRRWV